MASLGRFHGIDRFAEKYYSMAPYQYGGNNPINSVDINGDSIRIVNGRIVHDFSPSKKYEGGDSYIGEIVKQLNNINESGEAGSTVVGKLHSSESNYYYVNAPPSSEDGAVSFDSYGESSGCGITYVTEGSAADIVNIAHESFHAYQHETGFTHLGTDAAEVGAFLFGAVITNDLMQGIFPEIPFYTPEATGLLYDGYDKVKYHNMVSNFKRSDKNATGIYNNIQSGAFPTNPAIKKFIPLKKY